MPTRTGARDRLVTATIALLRERGVHGTGVAEVLERSGTARGSLYQHFPGGKADLVVEATRSAGRRAARHVGQTSDGTPGSLLDALVDWWVATLTKHDFGRGCPVAAAALDDTDEVTDAAGRVFTGWTEELTRALAEGRDAEESRRLAGFVISSLEGALLQCRALRSTRPLEDARIVLRTLVSPS
ncbi:MAG: TetR/AcrR family transcriptional regulator [Actinomycetales bacterium]|nr:MAG: TetR/AcrR family transcriptional regulator [Actinomycetales bacterium]